MYPFPPLNLLRSRVLLQYRHAFPNRQLRLPERLLQLHAAQQKWVRVPRRPPLSAHPRGMIRNRAGPVRPLRVSRAMFGLYMAYIQGNVYAYREL
jgi:hypothetical protein